MNITREDVERLCELNKEQRIAFNSLQCAYAKCEKANILFHQVLDTLEAYNGNNIDKITDEDINGSVNGESIYCTQTLGAPSLKTANAWADDNHFVHLKHSLKITSANRTNNASPKRASIGNSQSGC